MNKVKNVSFVSICLCIAVLAAGFAYAAVVDKVLAVVNDELITQSELDEILKPIYQQYKSMYSGDELLLRLDEARRNILTQMINDKLILSDARKKGIKINEDEIKEKIDGLKSKFKSEADFQNAIIEQGVTSSQLQKRFEEELLKEEYVSNEIWSKIVVTPTEINAYYNANIDKFKKEPQVHLLNILIRIKKGEDKEAAKVRADAVLERLKKGENFSELAKLYSEGADAESGGDIGYVGQGKLKKEFDEPIFKLKPGEFTSIIESGTGYHIFMVADKKETETLSPEEASDSIKEIIYRHKAKARFDDLIEQLKKNAYISIK